MDRLRYLKPNKGGQIDNSQAYVYIYICIYTSLPINHGESWLGIERESGARERERD